jgi:integrase
MPLTDARIRSLKPKPRLYRVADAHGLAIEVTPQGSRLWRLRFRRDGKETMASLGAYPIVSLSEARSRAFEMRKGLASGIDPVRHAKPSESTFRAMATEWLERHEEWADSTRTKTLIILRNDVLPYLGERPVAAITAAEVVGMLKRIEERGSLDMARRARGIVRGILRYCVAHGKADRNVAADFDAGDVIRARAVKHRSAVLAPADVGALLRASWGYKGSAVVRAALQLLPLTFVRPGELRGATWGEFNLAAAEWRIPASRTKMRRDHLVPLSTQAIEVLRSLEPLTRRGADSLVFPGNRPGRPISENTLCAAYATMGIEHTAHGWRAVASTLLRELGENVDVIERQLAHVRRGVVAAYDRSTLMPERRALMARWADYLDGLRSS